MIFSLFLLLIIIKLVNELIFRGYSDTMHPKSINDDDIEEISII